MINIARFKEIFETLENKEDLTREEKITITMYQINRENEAEQQQKQKINQKLQKMIAIFEELSNEPVFDKICKETRTFNDIALVDAWTAIEAAIELLEKEVI